MAPAEAGELVRLRGSPTRLTGAAQLPARGALHLEVRLNLPAHLEEAMPFFAQPLMAESGAPTLLRLSLPTWTPPGTYSGSIRVGENTHDLEVEVEPLVQFRFIPPGLVLRGAPGSSVTDGFKLLNTGNVPFDVREVYAFGVFDVDGMDDAFGQTFRAKLKPGERRVDLFAEALAKGHGGLVRVRIDKGAGTVPPATTNEVAATFRLPDRMRPGRTYSGTLPLEYARYGVRIETTGTQREKKEAE